MAADEAKPELQETRPQTDWNGVVSNVELHRNIAHLTVYGNVEHLTIIGRVDNIKIEVRK